jgi:hypothetical protein
MVKIIAWLAPLFVVFEVTQIIVAQRFIGIDQIRAGLHPLEVNPRGPPFLGLFWVLAIFADYFYQVLLLFQPSQVMNLAGLLLLMISFIGLGLRRGCGLKWGLVVLTVEGAARGGFLSYMFMATALFHRFIPRGLH